MNKENEKGDVEQGRLLGGATLQGEAQTSSEVFLRLTSISVHNDDEEEEENGDDDDDRRQDGDDNGKKEKTVVEGGDWILHHTQNPPNSNTDGSTGDDTHADISNKQNFDDENKNKKTSSFSMMKEKRGNSTRGNTILSLPTTNLQRQRAMEISIRPGAYARPGIHAGPTTTTATASNNSNNQEWGQEGSHTSRSVMDPLSSSSSLPSDPPLLTATLVVEEPPLDYEGASASPRLETAPVVSGVIVKAVPMENIHDNDGGEQSDDDDDDESSLQRSAKKKKEKKRQRKILLLLLALLMVCAIVGFVVGVLFGGDDKNNTSTNSDGSNSNISNSSNNENEGDEEEEEEDVDENQTRGTGNFRRAHYLVQWTASSAGCANGGSSNNNYLNPALQLNCGKGDLVILDTNHTICTSDDSSNAICFIKDQPTKDGAGGGGGGGNSGGGGSGPPPGSSGYGGGDDQSPPPDRLLSEVEMIEPTSAGLFVDVGAILVACDGSLINPDETLRLRAQLGLIQRAWECKHTWIEQQDEDGGMISERRIYGGAIATDVMGALFCAPGEDDPTLPKLKENQLEPVSCVDSNLINLDSLDEDDNEVVEEAISPYLCSKPKTCHVEVSNCTPDPDQLDLCRDTSCTIQDNSPVAMEERGDNQHLIKCSFSRKILDTFPDRSSLETLWREARPVLIGVQDVERYIVDTMEFVEDIFST